MESILILSIFRQSIFSIIQLRSLLAVADCLLFPVAGISFSLGAIGEKLIIR